ncbi:GerMN domain-containing protein [Aerococcus urinaeequi]|uniref:GerMN domain-containing protein n=1 Tax=Aerococcus urinaeequi TaxID=51665 RepID=UPI003D6A8F26
MKQKATWFLLLSTSLLLGSCSWFNNAEDIYDESETSSSEQVSSSASDKTSEDSQSSQSSSAAENDTDNEASENSSSEEAPALTVADYFPMIEGYQAVFEGDGNEFSGFTRTYDFINDEFLTMRTATAGTTTVEVVAITADKAEVMVTKPETYSHEELTYDMIRQPDEPTRVLIEGPIEVGHTFDSDGRQREITGIDVPVETKTGTYETLEVSEYSENSIRREYYAPDVGLVYAEDESTDPEAYYFVTQILSELSYEGWGEKVTFYYPNGEGEFEQANETVAMTTNDDMALKFTQIFQGGNSADQQMMTKSVDINSISVDGQDPRKGKIVYVDFSENISELADDPQGKAKLDAMMATMGQYYNADYIQPAIEGDYMVIDGVVELTPAYPLYEVPENIQP